MRGFSLLEVIIALMIAGMAAVVLFEAAGSGLRETKTASMYDQAIVRAKSRLAAATHGTKLAAGDWRGVAVRSVTYMRGRVCAIK